MFHSQLGQGVSYPPNSPKRCFFGEVVPIPYLVLFASWGQISPQSLDKHFSSAVIQDGYGGYRFIGWAVSAIQFVRPFFALGVWVVIEGAC
jgi:hypothetical protein